MAIGVSASPEDPRRRAPQQLAQLALELAHPGLAGVLRDHLAQDRVGGLDLVRAQPVSLHLAGPQVPARDRQLLLGGVAVESDHLHAVEQGAGIVSTMLAVARKTTSERSTSTSR